MIMAFTSSVVAQDWTNEQKEVWQIVEDGWKAWQAGDIENAVAAIHEDFQGWNSMYPLPSNKDKVIKNYKMMKDMMKVQFYDIEPARIAVTDNAAVVHYYFTFYAVFTMGDEKWEEKTEGKNTEFYVKEKGEWVLLGDMTFIKKLKD